VHTVASSAMGSGDCLRYLSYYAILVFACIFPPTIDPHDPLENEGDFDVERILEHVPIEYKGEHVTLDAELFLPIGVDPDAFVLFMPGFGASYTGYTEYLEHLASHAFLAVGMDFVSSTFSTDGEHDIKAYQALDTISYILAVYPEFEQLPIFTAGHSLGGKIAFYSASLSRSIDGVMALDPVNAGGPPCFLFPDQCIAYPVAPNNHTGQEGVMQNIANGTSSLIFRSAPDPLTNPDEQFNADNFYFGMNGQGLKAAPSPAWYYDFGPFPHALYLSSFPSKQVQIIKRTMIAFLEQVVLGVNRSDYLTGSIIQRDIDDRLLESVDSR
jgi:pimeloyl-ACP methyl ester carboxylesterase